jgi:hypothetical protein
MLTRPHDSAFPNDLDPGLRIREYFAAKVMQGLMASDYILTNHIAHEGKGYGHPPTIEEVEKFTRQNMTILANAAVLGADALIARLNTENPRS